MSQVRLRFGFLAAACVVVAVAVGCGRSKSSDVKATITAEPSASAAPSASASTSSTVVDATAKKPKQCQLVDRDGLDIARKSVGALRGFSVAVGDDAGAFASVLGNQAFIYDVKRTSLDDVTARSLDGTEAAAVVIPRKGGIGVVGRYGRSPFGLQEEGAGFAPTWPDTTTRRVIRVGATGRAAKWFAAGVSWKLACETDDDKCVVGLLPGPGRSLVERRGDGRTAAELAIFYDDGHGTVAEPLEEATCDGVDCEGNRFRWDALTLAMDDATTLVAWRDLATIKVLPRAIDGKKLEDVTEPMLVAGGGELSRPSLATVGDTFWIVFSMRPKPGAPHAIWAASWKRGQPKTTVPKKIYAPEKTSATGASIAVRPDGKIALAWAEGDGKLATLKLGVGDTVEGAVSAPVALTEKQFPARDTTLAFGKPFGLIAWTEPSTAAGAKLYEVAVRGARIECP
jgi:hypothetical protein